MFYYNHLLKQKNDLLKTNGTKTVYRTTKQLTHEWTADLLTTYLCFTTIITDKYVEKSHLFLKIQ